MATTAVTASVLPSDADWARIRPIFEQLYIEEHRTLTDVMRELNQLHNFRATKQMYKRHIREWGLWKNLKQNEVEHILGISAQRRAQGKATRFVLRGKWVDMRDVRTFQRRKKLDPSVAVAAYAAGRSTACRGLRALTPELFDAAAWRTPDQSYENALRAFGAFFYGLVDSRYYWIEANEIVMPPSQLRGEMSDVCSSLVAAKHAGDMDMVIVRKLALLLESIVYSDDAWIHCRLVYTLWVLTTVGHSDIARLLLAQLNGLVAAQLHEPCAQLAFVQSYSNLQTTEVQKLAADMISLKARMVSGFRVGSDPNMFKLRSLDYDVFWREREQKGPRGVARAIELFERCHRILGPLAVETLTIVRTILQDDAARTGESEVLDELLESLRASDKLSFCIDPTMFIFDEHALGLEAASELACIYCLLGMHTAEAWIFQRLLTHQKQTASGLRREYSLLVHIGRCGEISLSDRGQGWARRKQEIECVWQEEVEAAAVANGALPVADLPNRGVVPRSASTRRDAGYAAG